MAWGDRPKDRDVPALARAAGAAERSDSGGTTGIGLASGNAREDAAGAALLGAGLAGRAGAGAALETVAMTSTGGKAYASGAGVGEEGDRRAV